MIKPDAGATGATGAATRAISRQRKTADAASMITENDDGAGPVIGDRRKAGQDEPDPVSRAPGRRRQQA
jgi:hypothetical protein